MPLACAGSGSPPDLGAKSTLSGAAPRAASHATAYVMPPYVTPPWYVMHHDSTIHRASRLHDPCNQRTTSSTCTRPCMRYVTITSSAEIEPGPKKKHKAPLRHGCTHAFSAPPTKLGYIISTLGSSTFAFNN